MPDPIFAHPRLADIYDDVDSDRSDLDLYAASVRELGARSVLDVGCGTGTLATMLARTGAAVIAVDPAAASLDVARRKPGAEAVTWIHGDATSLPSLSVDIAVMTGNVAQVFLDDERWLATLSGIASAVRPGGGLVFETRIPERRAWERWTRTATHRNLDTAAQGRVETWIDVLDVSPPFVTFRHTFRFVSDGAELASDSTLRFRDRGEIVESLRHSGWRLLEVLDAPDRPGDQWVFVASRRGVNPAPAGK